MSTTYANSRAHFRRREASRTRSRCRWGECPIEDIQVQIHIDGLDIQVETVERLGNCRLNPHCADFRHGNDFDACLARDLEVRARIGERLDTNLNDLRPG